MEGGPTLKYGNTVDLTLHFPFRIAICGSSSCGKTTATLDLIRKLDHTVDQKIEQVIYLYNEESPDYTAFAAENKNVIFINDVKLLDSYINPDINQLVCIDDFLIKLQKEQEFSDYVTTFFCQKSHHTNTAVIFIVQNIFAKNLRTCRLNCTHLCIFANRQDSSSLRRLASQIMPTKFKSFINSYYEAVKSPHGYLFIDFSSSDNSIRLSNSIYPRIDTKIYNV